jgi:hypothetical protein
MIGKDPERWNKNAISGIKVGGAHTYKAYVFGQCKGILNVPR